MNNKSEHIDKKFTDQAWKEMSLILDVEMPVKKSKRGLFWLWGVGFCLVVISSFIYFGKENTPSISAFPIAKIKSKKTDNQLVIRKISNNTSKSNKKSSDVPPVFQSTKVLTLSSHSVEGTILPSTEAGILNEKIKINQFKLEEIIPPSNKISIESLSIIDSKKGLNQQINQNIEQKSLANFDNTPTLKFNLLKVDGLKMTIPTKTIKVKSKWAFGVFAGLIFPKIGGYKAGIISKYDLNQRWAIHLGLGYSKRTVNQPNTLSSSNEKEMDLGAAIQEDSTILAPTSPGNIPSNTDELEIIPSVTYKNFHYFDLPVFVQYKITPRWAIEIGGQVSKLYGFQYAQDDQSFFSTNSQKLESEAIRASTNFTEVEVASIEEWQFAALGGTSYTINSKIQLYSNFHLGLNNYLKQENSNRKWRQMEVGLRYYFK